MGIFPGLCEPGDVVLCPDPGYPVYEASTNFVGAEIVRMPLLEKNNFLPDLDAIPADKLGRAKLMWLNSPNNPTAAVAPLAYLKKAVEFCKKHGIILAHDMAYSGNLLQRQEACLGLGSAGSQGSGHRIPLPVQDL